MIQLLSPRLHEIRATLHPPPSIGPQNRPPPLQKSLHLPLARCLWKEELFVRTSLLPEDDVDVEDPLSYDCSVATLQLRTSTIMHDQDHLLSLSCAAGLAT